MDELLAGRGGDFAGLAGRSGRRPRRPSSLAGAASTCWSALAGPRPSDLPAQIHRVRAVLRAAAGGSVRPRRSPGSATWSSWSRFASRYPDRRTCWRRLTLDPPSSTQDLAGPPLLDDDYLVLSTIHSAKGLEWDAVYVIHAADGNIPSDMATGIAEEIEEERRLFYVALTRAKNWLYVCCPLRYYHRAPADRPIATATPSSLGSCRLPCGRGSRSAWPA